MLNIQDYITKENIRRKNRIDSFSRNLFMAIAILSASSIILIVGFILSKGIQPFISVDYLNTFGTGTLDPVNVFEFLTGEMWLNGPVGEASNYGIGYAIINTLIAVFWAIIIATPVSVLTALFIAMILPKRLAATLRQVVELLASIPSIIYGVFGLGVIAPFVAELAVSMGYQTSAGLSLMTTSLVLAIMIMPTITAVSETAIRSVSKPLIQGSLALGATEMQTYFKVVIAASKSGIFAGVILGVGRALGEATAVAMVSGNLFAGITWLPFDTTTTLTSRMLLGIKETIGMDYDIRFSVGVALMGVIVLVNVVLRAVMKRVGNLDE